MTKKEYLVQEYSKYIDGLLSRKMDFYYNPSTARIEPFKIADGLWYVGDKKVCIRNIYKYYYCCCYCYYFGLTVGIGSINLCKHHA